jgi:hypothetical protein
MAGYGGTWSLCGGWAVDAWLGQPSREHGDLDISIFEDEQHMLYEHLEGWQLLGHDAAWERNNHETWWDGRYHLTTPAHIHARGPERKGAMPKDGIAREEDGFWLDIQVDGRSGGDWVVRREPRIVAPLSGSILESPWGVPTTVPELLLFFKAGEPRMRDKLDFAALRPLMSEAQRRWLHDAVSQLEHPWLERLGV